MLALLTRLWFLRRLLRGRRHGRHAAYSRAPLWSSGRQSGRYGYGRRRSSGIRFFGPFPTYSRRTRRGGTVSVGG